jgi:hypothetical protein
VTAFIAAMNGWEIASWKAQRACRESDDPSAYQPGVLHEMIRIFANYCIPKERKYGRNGSFQKPPEYDPACERVVDVAIDDSRRRAYVTTQREAILGGGTYRYTLLARHKKWLIDNVKQEVDGTWNNSVL